MGLFKRRSEDPSPELVSATPISPEFALREAKNDSKDVKSPVSSQEGATSSSFSARKGNYFLVTNSTVLLIRFLIYYRGSLSILCISLIRYFLAINSRC